MMKILNEMKDMVFILLVTGVFSWVANLINIHPDLGASAIGVFLLVVLASIGIFISKLPGFHKLPMVFWVSIVAVMVSIPGFPGGDVVISYTKQVSFLALTTPVSRWARTWKLSRRFPGESFPWHWPWLPAASFVQRFWLKSCWASKVYSDA